jgi:hypothetical protein
MAVNVATLWEIANPNIPINTVPKMRACLRYRLKTNFFARRAEGRVPCDFRGRCSAVSKRFHPGSHRLQRSLPSAHSGKHSVRIQ